MKIVTKNIKSNIVSYFKDSFDQAIAMIILFITVANAIFISIVFYIAVLGPGDLDMSGKDYKYIRIKVNEEVLENIDKREEIDQGKVFEIEKTKNPFE